MKFAALLILLVFILTGCSASVREIDASKNSGDIKIISAAGVNQNLPVESGDDGNSEQEEKEIRSVTLVCAGDNLIHSPIYNQAFERGGDNGYDFSPVYEDTAAIIRAADLAVLNQETIITGEYPPSNYPTFCTPAAMGDEIAGLGFDAVSISNNHLLDKGEEGLISTLNYWETEHPEITLYGAYKNKTDIPVIEINGISFAFLGFMEHTNGLELPEDSECKITYLNETEEVKRQVKLADKLADCVIVSAHYGLEVSGEVTAEQLEITQNLGDWGADIIIGTQPHTVQPMEFFKTSRGTDAFVFYCLGNYVSAMDNPLAMIGMLGFLTVNKYSYGKTEIVNTGALPIITHYEDGYKNVKIYNWSGYSEELAKKHGCTGFTYEFAKKIIKSKIVIEDYLDETSSKKGVISFGNFEGNSKSDGMKTAAMSKKFEYKIKTKSMEILDKKLKSIAEENHAVGMSAAVFHNGEIIHTFNYGYADRENGIFCGDDTIYRTASVSKLISTIALMTLYDDGIITPESDLEELTGLPFNFYGASEKVKLWHLLTHTSGVNDGYAYDNGALYYYGLDYVLKNSLSGNIPGEVYSYSNLGLGTVGAIIEKITGQFFHDFADERLFKPLEMDAGYTIDFIENKDKAANIYSGGKLVYRPDDWGRTKEYYEKFGIGNSYLTAQCELLISCPNLARFGILLAGNGYVDGVKILSEKAVNLINEKRFSAEDFDLGLTVRIYENSLVKGRTIYGHPGQALGNLCGLYYDPTDGTGVAICTSGAGANTEDNGVYTLLDNSVKAVYKYFFNK